MNVTNRHQSLVKSEIRHYFIRLTIFKTLLKLCSERWAHRMKVLKPKYGHRTCQIKAELRETLTEGHRTGNRRISDSNAGTGNLESHFADTTHRVQSLWFPYIHYKLNKSFWHCLIVIRISVNIDVIYYSIAVCCVVQLSHLTEKYQIIIMQTKITISKTKITRDLCYFGISYDLTHNMISVDSDDVFIVPS